MDQSEYGAKEPANMVYQNVDAFSLKPVFWLGNIRSDKVEVGSLLAFVSSETTCSRREAASTSTSAAQ